MIRRALPLTALTLLTAILPATAEDSTEDTFIPRYAVASSWFTYGFDSDFSDALGEFGYQEAGIDANIPLIKRDGFLVTGGVNYRWNELDFSGTMGPFGTQSLELHRLSIPFNVWADLNDRWKLWVRLQPGVHSDFEDIDSDDFILTSLALASYQLNQSTRVAMGAFYSQDLGEERLLPALGVIIEPNEYLYMALTFPRLEVAYAPNEDWLFTGRAVLSGGSWNITDPTGGGEDVDLNHQAIRLGVGIDRRISGPLWGYVDAGYQLGQEIEIEDASYNYQEDVDSSPFVTLGVKFRF